MSKNVDNGIIFGMSAMYVVLAVTSVALCIGWILNLIHVVSGVVHNVPITTQFIFQAIGVPVAPIGAILGWLL